MVFFHLKFKQIYYLSIINGFIVLRFSNSKITEIEMFVSMQDPFAILYLISAYFY